MSDKFPTFERIVRHLRVGGWAWPQWMSTPWWPADSLASKQHALLQVLAVAASQRLEYAPLIKSLAAEHRGSYRRRLHRLSQRIAAGTPLSEALEQTSGALSEDQMLAIRFGIQSGTLPDVLRGLAGPSDQCEPSWSPIGQQLRQIGFYVALVSLLLLFVLSFIMIKIVPSFQAIMQDFSLDITDPLKLLIHLSRWVAQSAMLIVVGLLLCVWLIKSELPQRFLRRRVWSRLFQPVAQLRSANLLNLLAVAQQAGRPLPGAVSTLARYHYDSRVRHKLLFVRNEVEQGADIWSSLAQARLLSPAESQALASSTAADSTVWTLKHLATWKRNRVVRRFDVYVEFLLPIVIIAIGAVVLLTALATLTPLFKMINDLS